MCAPAAKLYRPRNPEASPFSKLVRDHFDEFEQVYDKRFQPKYGYWRPAIRSAMDKFLKCGDLREGFARLRCPDCGKEFFVVFSCKQRCCCPSCDQKRALLLGMRLTEEVFAAVGHRQWVLTMPKRLRLFFRNDRRLLGKLCWAALIKKVYEVDPLRCPACGGVMQIISFIDKCQPKVVEKILRHCGLWKTAESRPPPVKSTVAEPDPYYDYGYFDRVCI